MTTKPSTLRDIKCTAGVESSADSTAFNTQHYVFSDKIRFVEDTPEKIGGWNGVLFEYNAQISGACRTVYSQRIDGKVRTIFGTEKKVYGLIGSRLTNITPLLTTTIAVANSLNTFSTTLGANAFASVAGSSTITVTDASASKYVAGDYVTFTGATGFAGISAGTFNALHLIRSVGSGNYTINVGTVASSTGNGGGAGIVRNSGIITLNHVAHGLSNGDRVKISGAVAIGGILAVDINKEHIIRNVAVNSFDVMAINPCTSTVSNGGGAGTLYQKEIPTGRLNASYGYGYGVGLYGVGLYGVGAVSTDGVQYQRTWFCDSFSDVTLMTAGNQTGLYKWDGDTSVAPTLVTNAPTAINYMFVSNGIVVTLGAGGVENKIFSSEVNNITGWTSSSTNQVFEDNIEGAGRLLSHVSISDGNLIFTETQTYLMRYINAPLIWEIKKKSGVFGIIAPMARVTVNDVAYWMGDKNFYMWRGGDIEIIPSNSGKQSTILRYVFDNINYGQKSKSFAWYNNKFHEIWFHYPSSNSIEPDRIARLCLHNYCWVMDTMERTSAEYPDILLSQPRLAQYVNETSSIYRHETGNDANGQPMPWSLKTNLRSADKQTVTTVGVIPDSLEAGNIAFQFQGYLFPQSNLTTYNNSYTITPTTERITTLLNGRFWQYTFSGSELGQNWQLGNWKEYIQLGGDN